MQGRGLDAPLNETGHQQAQAVAEYLTSYHVDRVISSSMLRARQSAAHIAERLDKEAIAYEELDEMDFGNWEGRPVDEIDRKSTRLNSSHVAISYAVFCLK